MSDPIAPLVLTPQEIWWNQPTPVAPCANCGHEARDHMVEDEERTNCAACECKQYEAKS